MTGRPLHALRTPAIAFSRLNASVAPERLTTVSCIASTVVKRFSHSLHERRRRMDAPSSATRESSTRVSVCAAIGAMHGARHLLAVVRKRAHTVCSTRGVRQFRPAWGRVVCGTLSSRSPGHSGARWG